MSDLLVAPLYMKGESKSATIMPGAQSAMMDGVQVMQVWLADKLDSHD